MAAARREVAVIGGGVVGCAVAHALTRRGVAAIILEAESGLALGASGTNSGILHTGFDSTPGELETRLILRAAVLRESVIEELGVPLLRCGARLTAHDAEQRATVRLLARNAHSNGVQAHLGADGSLEVPGESVTDPVAFVHALAAAAGAGGAELRLGERVRGVEAPRGGGVLVRLAGEECLRVRAAVNCAGLRADELARLAGDELPAIYPRKGEFLVFSAPAGERLEEILLPVPSSVGKGVLVFPTIDGHVVAGPTAREREDKDDWSVEPDAQELILPKAIRMYPALAGAQRVGAYAGLRPAGRGANYVIERSRTVDGLLHVAAIRSTGLSASLAIGEHVAGMLAASGAVELGIERVLRPPPAPAPTGPWWERASLHRSARGQRGDAR
jgi:glycerol-3-phosphate dehydrogenase